MDTSVMPSAEIVFDTLFAYQRSAALKSAIELDVFTAIDSGTTTASAIATRCKASERGIRILCDFLCTIGLLGKSANAYRITPEAAAFLSTNSPAYLGTTMRFLLRAELKQNMETLTEAVVRGTVPPAGNNNVSDENPIWVEFARSMAPMMAPAAHAIAELVANNPGALKVLDIAAGHGLFGITIAQRNPRAEIVAVDWPSVLTVATGNAAWRECRIVTAPWPEMRSRCRFQARSMSRSSRISCTTSINRPVLTFSARCTPHSHRVAAWWCSSSCPIRIGYRRRYPLASAWRCWPTRPLATPIPWRSYNSNSGTPGSATSQRTRCRHHRRCCWPRSNSGAARRAVPET